MLTPPFQHPLHFHPSNFSPLHQDPRDHICSQQKLWWLHRSPRRSAAPRPQGSFLAPLPAPSSPASGSRRLPGTAPGKHKPLLLGISCSRLQVQELQHQHRAVSCQHPHRARVCSSCHGGSGLGENGATELPGLAPCASGPAELTLCHSHPRIPRAGTAWLRLALCPEIWGCHLDGLEPVQEGVHPPKELSGRKLPELWLLLGGERGCQSGAGVQGVRCSCTIPAPTGKNVGIRSEQ